MSSRAPSSPLDRWPLLRFSAADVTAAAVLAQAFTVYLLVLRWVRPATEDQWRHADPILLILPQEPTLWLVPALAIAVALAWWRYAVPSRDEWLRALRHAAVGLLVGLVAIGTLRLVAGPTLPSFIPAEESAGPGFLLSMTAGFGEEVIFRLVLLAGTFLLLVKRRSPATAVAVATLVASLGFALLHDAGQDVFSASYFVTRLLVPGCLMSLACFVVSPAFVVTAHSAAHVLIPALFV